MSFKILNSTSQDFQTILDLYETARKLQQKVFPEVVWPKFENQLITDEINNSKQWKLIIDNKIACIWAITYSDEQIWEQLNNQPAIYIHRIATNPDFKGLNFVEKIVTWAKRHAKLKNKKFIRLDTCGNNLKLIKHYKKNGFDFLGITNLKNTNNLPKHYHNAPVCRFEIKL